MAWLGTDLVALGCILGSAAVGGGATYGFLDGMNQDSSGCGVAVLSPSPRIAIAHGGRNHAILVSPAVRIRSGSGCLENVNEVVEVHLENQMEALDAQLEQLDEELEFQLQGLEGRIEASVQQEMEAQLQMENAMRRMEEARARVRVKVEKVGSGGI